MLIITDDGTIIRTPVVDISETGRNTQGVRLMRVGEGATIVDVARAEQEPEEEAEDDALGLDGMTAFSDGPEAETGGGAADEQDI